MRRLLQLMAAIPIVIAAHGALAFETCNTAVDPAQLRAELTDIALSRAPVRYHDLVGAIRLNTAYSGDRLMPVGAVQQQTKFILFTPLFVKVACQIALATYLYNDGVEHEGFDRAARSAAQCVDDGGTEKACLVAFGNQLEGIYSGSFATPCLLGKLIPRLISTRRPYTKS